MYDIDLGAGEIVLAQENERLEAARAWAVTCVRSHAVDETEAQMLLDMLGLVA